MRMISRNAAKSGSLTSNILENDMRTLDNLVKDLLKSFYGKQSLYSEEF